MRLGLVAVAALCAAAAWCQPKPPAEAPHQAPPADAAWLQKNLNDPRWPEALRAFLRQTPQVDRVRAALESLPELPQQLPADLALEIGGLLEIAGSPEAALRYYAHAAQGGATPAARTQALLAAAALACEIGADDQALGFVDRALAGIPEGTPRAEVAVARALLALEASPGQSALRDLRASTAAAPAASAARLQGLLALAEASRRLGQPADFDRLLDQLKTEFPHSPELALLAAEGRVDRALSPRRLLRAAAAPEPQPPKPPQEPQPPPPSPTDMPPSATVRIQTGSFTLAENATFMARDLKTAGFATITEKAELAGKTYYRVLLAKTYAPDEARTALIRLKEAGFEGFIVP